MDEIDVYLEPQGSSSYVESLIKSRQWLKDMPLLLEQLDKVISLELELAVLGAEKAKSEILKATKDNIKPIK
jgi:hypothetical protein